jgi:hypothetical protein
LNWSRRKNWTNLQRELFKQKLSLKVDGNEKMTWVGKEQVIQLLSGIVAIKVYLQFERAVNL